MVFCTVCGLTLDASFLFCWHCGTKVVQDGQTFDSSHQYCWRCGKTVDLADTNLENSSDRLIVKEEAVDDCKGIENKTLDFSYTQSNDYSRRSRRKSVKRTRWTEAENSIFNSVLSDNICQKTMPTGETLESLSHKLEGRTVAQLRAKIHNIISGKLKKY